MKNKEKMRGRDILIKQLKTEGKGSFFAGIILAFFGLGIALLLTSEAEMDRRLLLTGAACILMIGGIGLMIMGLIQYLRPSSDSYLVKNPIIYKRADELYANTIYKDDYIVISKENIGFRAKPVYIFPRDWILVVYMDYQSRWDSQYKKTVEDAFLNIITVKENFRVSFSTDARKDRYEINDFLDHVRKACRFCRIGNDNDMYIYEMRQKYKEYENKKLEQMTGNFSSIG